MDSRDADPDLSSIGDASTPSPRMRRFKFREKKRARSHTDLSRNSKKHSRLHSQSGGPDDDDDDDEMGAVLSRTEPSSPAKKSLGLRSANKRMQAVWASLKKFAPHKLRTRTKEEMGSGVSLRKRNHLHGIHGTERLSSSHPDVSCSDLAALAGDPSLRVGSCLDDDAVLLRVSGGEEPADFADVPSVSDPLLNRQMSLAERRIHFQNEGATTSFSGDYSSQRQADLLGPPDGEPSLPSGSVESILSRQKLRLLRQYAFFQLDVHLRCGKELLAKDACGTSDPYVKFKCGSKQVYKSKTIHKTLDPVWDEFFVLPIEDVFLPIVLRVFDYDFGMQDDFMGAAVLDLTRLDLHRATDLVLNLSETGSPNEKPEKPWGKIMLTVTLIPKTQEDKEQYFSKSGSKSSDATSIKKQKTQIWDSVVTIVLVEGKNLLPMDENGLSDPYCKFRLGTEKYKSKSAIKTLSPQWLEQFDLHMYPDQLRVLEITVWDKDFHGKDDFMGRCTIDLTNLPTEKTHRIWQDLEDGAGSIYLLLTISGTMGTETISDLSSYEPTQRQREALVSRYGIFRSMSKVNDVGHLVVKVFKAYGLAAADIGGKSDPFCVVELVNSRLQTHTEYKTLCPEWNKIFTFQVKDIHSVLELTVYDEDQNKKFEFLGKIAIPLLKVKNGERRWYALKDKKLRSRVKGQIMLELDVIYNPIRACIRTFNPKELKYMTQEQKFKRAVFMRNVNRVKMMALDIIEIARFLNSCFLWESPARSVLAFIVFLVVTYTFELYMLPIALLLLFLKNYIVLAVTGIGGNYKEEEEIENDDEDDDDDDRDGKGHVFALLFCIIYNFGNRSIFNLNGDDFNYFQRQQWQEEKKSLKEKLQAVQEVTAMVQNVLGELASLGERCKNTFNFTVPFLSWLAIIALVVVAFFLYLVPLRYIIMLWGINKFTKRLRSPLAVPNNELLDFLTRVPDCDERIMCRELKVQPPPNLESDRKKKKKTS